MNDFEFNKLIVGVCIMLGAMFGVGVGVLVGHTGILAGAGGAVGFVCAFPAIRRFEKSAEEAAKEPARRQRRARRKRR